MGIIVAWGLTPQQRPESRITDSVKEEKKKETKETFLDLITLLSSKSHPEAFTIDLRYFRSIGFYLSGCLCRQLFT